MAAYASTKRRSNVYCPKYAAKVVSHGQTDRGKGRKSGLAMCDHYQDTYLGWHINDASNIAGHVFIHNECQQLRVWRDT